MPALPLAAVRRAAAARLFAAALTLALAGLAPRPAAACDTPQTPCEIEGDWGSGVYHLATPDGPGPHPTVFFLHGYGGRAERTMANDGIRMSLLNRGYAVVTPQGMPRREGDSGGSWNAFAWEERRDDVAFLAAVAEDAAARAPLDRARMLASGFSGGGMMVWRVACDAPRTFAAYAPIAGLLWRPLPDACAGQVKMLHIHGWTDPVVPLEGRSVAGGRITQGDVFRGLDLLRDANACVKDDPDEYAQAGPENAFWLRRWTDCAPGSALEFALFHGGHRIPQGWSALTLDWFEGFDADPS
ncbi:MAG: CocE/NonD family hydrolase [Pseudomonadota bacterium]